MLAALFLLILGAGAAGLAFGDGATGENRRLSPAPGWPHAWTTWPREVDAWVADRFGLRDPLIRLHARLAFALRTQESRRVVLRGQDGWLFYGDRFSRLSYQRLNPLTPADAVSWRDVLLMRQHDAKAAGAAYLFVATPDKHTVYPEFMPNTPPVLGSQSRLQALRPVGTAALGPAYLDLEPVLLQARGRVPLYYRTDTHWTAYGAYIGYQAVLARLDALGFQMPSITEAGFPPRSYDQGDLARMLAVPLQEGTVAAPATPCDASPGDKVRHATCPGGRLRALVVHDSFGVALMPYLASSFAETVFVAARPSAEQFRALLVEHRPDVVIEERVERMFNTGLADGEPR